MFILDLLTVFTDALDVIFGFLTGVLSLLATLCTLNERLLLFVIDSFQSATDQVYCLLEFLDKLFTWQLSDEVFNLYGLESVNNIFDRIVEWFLRVFQQCLSPYPIVVSLAVVFAVLLVIQRRKLIECLKYLIPNRRLWNRFAVWNTNEDREVDWNTNENLHFNNHDNVLRPQTLNEGDSSSVSDDVASNSGSAEVIANSHAERHSPCREASRKNNVDNIRCTLRSQEDRLLCVVCQDNSKSVLVLPCRHLCMCQACAKVINSDAELPKICPLCRTAINRLVNVYV